MAKILMGCFFILMGILMACSNDATGSAEYEKDHVHIFAAASLGEVLGELTKAYEEKHQSQIKINFESSGTLARQIIQGADPDIYLSANRKWVNYVDSLGFIQGDIAEVGKNRLVLVSPKESELSHMELDSTLNLLELLGGNRLSVGDPMHVPAGMYAKEALLYFAWDYILKDHILPAKDVRAALRVVELGEAPLGIVYRTDAIKSEQVKIMDEFPAPSHSPIEYLAALCKDNQAAKGFFVFLRSDKSKSIWQKYGFE
ncbi:MAG: molybdate ABC transporter substrate-binding protein [Bacteroidota bacterium]